MLHIDIIYLADWGQKYATMELRHIYLNNLSSNTYDLYRTPKLPLNPLHLPRFSFLPWTVPSTEFRPVVLILSTN